MLSCCTQSRACSGRLHKHQRQQRVTPLINNRRHALSATRSAVARRTLSPDGVDGPDARSERRVRAASDTGVDRRTVK